MNNPDSKYNGEKLVLTKKDDGKMYITLSDGTITDKRSIHLEFVILTSVR